MKDQFKHQTTTTTILAHPQLLENDTTICAKFEQIYFDEYSWFVLCDMLQS